MAMIRTGVETAAIALLALLAGCGGGAGGSAGGLGSTPPPVDGPAYTALANASASTPLASRAVHYALLPASRTATIDIRYDAASATYTVRGIPVGGSTAIEQSFGPADKNSSGVYVRPATASTPAASLTTFAGFTYASIGRWATSIGAGSEQRIDTVMFAFGVPTQASDMPRSGSASYDLGLYGDPHDPPLEGKGSIRANFAAATVDVMIAPLFRYRPIGMQSDEPFTTLTGTGAITSADGSPGFSATLTSNNGYSGSVAGAFYGPQAAEVGGAYTITNPVGGYFNGAVLGRKN